MGFLWLGVNKSLDSKIHFVGNMGSCSIVRFTLLGDWVFA